MTELDPPTEYGRQWAILSYVGLICLVPVGIIPLIQRDDAYALHHAKVATVVWIGVLGTSIALAMVWAVIVVVTCGLGVALLPLVFLPTAWGLVVGIHGLVLTLNGAWDEPIGGFGLGDALFGSIEAKPRDRFPPTV